MRTGAMQSITDNYESLQANMEIASHHSDDCSRRASGIRALINFN